MPELPEVQTVVDGLRKVLEGRKILSVEGYYPGTLILDPQFPEDAFPATIRLASRIGKYIVIALDGGATIIIHLRMTGKLVYEPHPEDIHKHERARILLNGGDAIRFIDPRTFGKITLLNSKNMNDYLPELGPDPLTRDFNEKYLYQSIHHRKAPIKNLLLDQALVAGLGNIYVCELLYRSGIRPDKPGLKITHKEATKIVRHTREILIEAIAVGGTSISDYRRIDDKTGEFQNFLKVYQKTQCPGGHELANLRLAGRSSFFCPLCQK